MREERGVKIASVKDLVKRREKESMSMRTIRMTDDDWRRIELLRMSSVGS